MTVYETRQSARDQARRASSCSGNRAEVPEAGSVRVTLAFTTFNVERYLAGAFDAVLAQDYTDFEVVVCDNRSTDGTWDICQRYAAKDDRFRIHRNETNLGVAGNFQRAVSLARGEFFRLTAHDDLMAPTLLRRCVEVLDANPAAVLAYPRATVIDDDGAELFVCEGEPDLRDARPSRRIADLVRAWQLNNEIFGLIRTDVLRRTRGHGAFASGDRRLLVELAALGEFHLIPEALFYRRVHRLSTFGGGRDATERSQWLEPNLRGQGRFDWADGAVSRMTYETVKALLRNQLPRSTRLRTATAFAVAWPARCARVTLGRWRRQLVRLPAAIGRRAVRD